MPSPLWVPAVLGVVLSVASAVHVGAQPSSRPQESLGSECNSLDNLALLVNPSRAGPGYTEEARIARLNGSVLLNVTVNANGEVADVQVRRPLGLGLDESAASAVKLWRFHAPIRKGQAVCSVLLTELNFRTQSPGVPWVTSELVFTASSSQPRPRLKVAVFPDDPPPSTPAEVQIEFDVGPEGATENLHIVHTSAESLNKQVLRALREWRFSATTASEPSRPAHGHITFAFCK
jgi:TonB family protein